MKMLPRIGGRFGSLAALLIVAGTPALAQVITVEPNVRVSRAHSDRAHYEIHMAADPTDAARLLGGTMVWDDQEGIYGVVAYGSSDGGRSWEPVFELHRSGYVNDPAVAFGPDGTAYLAAFGADIGERTEMYLQRSSDGGVSWTGNAGVALMDREFITVDRTGGDFHGRVYLNGTRGARSLDGGTGASGLTVVHSSDGGVTFAPPVTLVTEGEHYVLGMGNGVVLSDGTLVILYGERQDRDAIDPREPIPTQANASLKVVTSHDGGVTFETAALVHDWYMRFGAGSTGMTPSLGADLSGGPFADRLYAAWTDFRSGRGEILLSFSSDGGKTWSDATAVNDDRANNPGPGPDDFLPVVAVNKDGVVGVSWYDRRDNPDNLGWWVRFAASVDGGETFLPSVRVSEAPFDFQHSDGLVFMGSTTGGGNPNHFLRGGRIHAGVVLHHFNNKGGDTAGMAADASGAFHPFWIDNRTGKPQAWTAVVRVDGSATPNGDPLLSNLGDISQKVTLRLTNTRYDAGRGIATFDASVVNTSEDTLRGPIKLRVLALGSEFGTVVAIDADNGIARAGAVWDFSDGLVGGKLLPGAGTTPRRLTFRIEDVRPLDAPDGYPPGRGGYSVVSLDAKVLGRAPDTAKPDAGSNR